MAPAELTVRFPTKVVTVSSAVLLASVTESANPNNELSEMDPKLLPRLSNTILPPAKKPEDVNEARPPTVTVLSVTWLITPPELIVKFPALTATLSSAVSLASDNDTSAPLAEFSATDPKLLPPRLKLMLPLI